MRWLLAPFRRLLGASGLAGGLFLEAERGGARSAVLRALRATRPRHAEVLRLDETARHPALKIANVYYLPLHGSCSAGARLQRRRTP